MLSKLTFLILCSFLIFISPSLATSNSNKKLYEQTCSTSEDCNQSLGLSCQNKVCKCDPTGATVYSLSKNRCVGAAGRECLQLNLNGNNTVRNIPLCVENSICRDYEYMHLCTCKDGFYQSKDGNCYSIAKYGETCIEEDYSCGDTVTTSVSCMEQKCRCLLGDENQYYDPKEHKCISYAGGQCVSHYFQPCTKNSYCSEFNENIHGASFVIGHKCICAAGYSLTKSRQCLARYGTNCGINNPCNYDEYLGCLNGRCQCRNPLNELYNQPSSQCSILVGSTCRIDDPQKCVDNSKCVKENGTNTTNLKHGKCQCKNGYSATPMNTCLLDINQKCEPNQCNFYNALTCINATCNCIDSYLSYDKVSKSCVSLVGLPCGSVYLFDDTGAVNEKSDVVVLCEANAVCSKLSNSGSLNGAAKRVCKPAGTKH